MRGRLSLIAVFLVWAMAACTTVRPTPPDDESGSPKIHFDLSGLNQDGLYGPPDGLRSLSYELCIPARQELVDEVRAIDPTIQVFPAGRGRIGCTSDQYLCVGHTHQPGHRAILARLARLDYVTRIEPSYAE
jgi:hypothetical protein